MDTTFIIPGAALALIVIVSVFFGLAIGWIACSLKEEMHR